MTMIRRISFLKEAGRVYGEGRGGSENFTGPK